MQRFRFPLEKVREWRGTQVELEEARLEKLLGERQQLEAALAQLDAGRVSEERAVLRQTRVAAEQLAALDYYRIYVEERKRQTQAQIDECGRSVAQQRTRLMEARRNFELLDRLKERRLAEWRLDFSREQEALAGELYLARWRRSGP